MSLALSPLTWVAIAIMAAAVAAAVSKRFLATGALMVGNVAVFLLILAGPPATVLHGPEGDVAGQVGDMTQVQQDTALYVPNLLEGTALGVLQLFTSMFAHFDVFHLLGNMIFLWAFGMPFEERIGARRFLAVYFVSGVVGALCQIGVNQYTGGGGILLGASGAIFGIMCAFAVKYPNQVVAVPVPLLFVFLRIPMRVLYGALLWVGYNIVLGVAYKDGLGGVAYFAHLGGGLGGALMAVAILRHVAAAAGSSRIAIDLGALGDFARDGKTKEVLTHMRQNNDEPEVFQAWLDRFFRTATCPTCSHRVMPRHRGEVVCTQGHTFDVRQDRTRKLPPTA